MFSKYDLHEAMEYKPGETPRTSPPTPQQMRVGMARASYCSTILRQINNVAEHEGWSGEDKYTALAFYTTLQLEVYQMRELRRLELEPAPLMVFPNRPCGPVKDATFCGEKAAEDIFKTSGPFDATQAMKRGY